MRRELDRALAELVLVRRRNAIAAALVVATARPRFERPSSSRRPREAPRPRAIA